MSVATSFVTDESFLTDEEKGETTIKEMSLKDQSMPEEEAKVPQYPSQFLMPSVVPVSSFKPKSEMNVVEKGKRKGLRRLS